MATFNRFASLASASADENGEPFIIVDNKRSKRQRHNSPQLSQSQQSSSIMAANKSAKRPGTLLYGKASSQSASTKITAAKRIRKKCVFCIDNVHIDCTVDDMLLLVVYLLRW